ncbi:PepSY domain-containing protein [Leuconostoc rapi]|uniref:PepSY domain-containing protein n=1 Tax=Leuconostoc rapi TaxID=1406906 RepID=UPI001959CE40|nr:PepSY domain-containing protein [Leuconostoc rapi]MBM7435116.1 putative membrane protein YkoI [Leuconostoc rapi]
MFKKWTTTALLIIISLLLIVIAYLLYNGQKNISPSTQSSEQTSVSTSTNSSGKSDKNDNNFLSVDKVRNIFNQRYENTTITSIEFDKTLLSTFYDITGVDNDTEYSLKIHADTGKVISHDKESLDTDEANGIEKKSKAIDFVNIIPLENAVTKAKQSAKKNGSVKSWSLEKSDSITQWEIVLNTDSDDISVKINAQNGQVLEQETDD